MSKDDRATYSFAALAWIIVLIWVIPGAFLVVKLLPLIDRGWIVYVFLSIMGSGYLLLLPFLAVIQRRIKASVKGSSLEDQS